MNAAQQSPASSRLLPGIAVMLTTVMVIMDMTIVNVTLPHMMGALGATADQVTWVLTAYIVAEAVTIPLTGWLAGRFGRRSVLLGGIAGFVAASALCGQSTSLTEIVVFRLLQGVAGAPLIPLSQADAGAGLFNLARTLGSAMGVSIAATAYTRFGQIGWNQLGGHINPFNPALYRWLQAHGLTLSDPLAPVLLAEELGRQASMLAFTRVFQLIALSFLVMAPLLLLLRRGDRSPS